MTAPANICAQCKHFKMKEYPKHAQVGLGRCMGYDDEPVPLKNPFTAWGTKKCVRFKQDWDGRAARTEWVEKQLAKQKAVRTATKG